MSVKPLSPPDSSKPGMPGGMKEFAIGPISAPPRVRRSALRSKPAMTALRMLMLSNGFLSVRSAIQRVPPPETRPTWSLFCLSARARIGIGGWPESQHRRPWPCSVRREATVRSSLPSSIVISSS
jgi:hypothetical protein